MEKQLLSSYRVIKKLDIEFENVWCSVKNRGAYKKIIRGVSGKFKSGELTAIMGPSGAGKTSLLNILTGYHTSGVEGVIKCNNGHKNKTGPVQYKNQSCYILQDDQLLSCFTVYELMYSTTKLKIDAITRNEADFLIDDILTTLGLIRSKSTLCGHLSGGQKKRLSVALELIDDPPIMFLDEPTTGLDSNSSRQCIEMLKSLAEKGRTIICTIHQPSAPLFMTFDLVYVMAAGKCIFQGAPESCVPFLASEGFVCPQYHNPADFVLEVASGEYGNSIDLLSHTIKERIKLCSETIEEKEKTVGPIITRENLPVETNTCIRRPPSEWRRFNILLKKQLTYLYKDWTVAKLKFSIHLLVGLFLGVTYQNVGYDASRAITNMSFLLISVIYISYTALMPATLKFPFELAVMKKEHFNRWYKLRTYYASFLAADIPMQIVFTTAYCVGSYIISSQPLEAKRFFMVLLIQTMAALISSGLGNIFGTLVDAVNGTFITAVLTAINICLAGFLCLLPHMNKVMYALSNLSYFRYCMGCLLQAIYGYDRPTLFCPEEEVYCMHTSPTELLKEVGMDQRSFWVDFSYLIVNLFVLRILGYVALSYRVRG